MSECLRVDYSLLQTCATGRKSIARHRRLRTFREEDDTCVIGLIGRVDHVFVTPNTLTEASNLLAQQRDPERSRLFRVFWYLIEKLEEIVVASSVDSRSRMFDRLWLTDAALLEVISAETPLITVD